MKLTKKFKVTFEIESIPYNKDSFELLGPCFMENYPEDVFAKMDIGDILQSARFQNVMRLFELLEDGDNSDRGNDIKYKNRINEMLDQISKTIKFESID